MSVVWGKEPSHRPRINWDEVTAELKTRPGEWAKLTNPRASSAAWNTGRALLKSLGFEASTRKESDGFYLYARWPEEEI